MKFRVINNNCTTGNLKVDCNHTWTIPNFGEWLTEKGDQMPLWLHGETFSPVSGCILQIQILAIASDNVSVFLKNCGNKVNINTCSLVLTTSSQNKCSEYNNLLKLSSKFGELLFLPKKLQYEFNFDWSNKIGWTKTSGNAAPMQAIIIKCESSIGLNEDLLKQNVETAGRNLKQDMEKLMFNPSFPDWTLICGGEEIKCHRSILGARSTVFETMFEQTGFQESKTNQTHITDTEFSTIKALLKYIYTDIIDPENDHIEELFVAAEKYDIQGLRSRCELYLCEKLSVENSAELFLLSYMNGGKHLKEKSMEMIARNYKSVKLTEKWIEIQNNPDLSPALVQIIDYMSNLV